MFENPFLKDFAYGQYAEYPTVYDDTPRVCTPEEMKDWRKRCGDASLLGDNRFLQYTLKFLKENCPASEYKMHLLVSPYPKMKWEVSTYYALRLSPCGAIPFESYTFNNNGFITLLSDDPDAWFPTFTFINNTHVLGYSADSTNAYYSEIKFKRVKHSYDSYWTYYFIDVGDDELVFAIKNVKYDVDPILLDHNNPVVF